MFNPAIGRSDYTSTSGARTQSSGLQSETTLLDQVRNSPTTADLLRGVDLGAAAYEKPEPENPRQADGLKDVDTRHETKDDRTIRDARSDELDRQNIELDNRWDREPGGDGGYGHLDSDWAGRSILDRYLTGGGDWTIEDNPRWTEYMQDNVMLTFDLRSRAVDTAQELFDGDDSAINIDETYAMEIENGEGIIGYQYLHGTNANAGGFERDGTASIVRNADGSATVTLNMEYRWNDVIDPNPQYSTDRWKSGIAEMVTLGQADPYEIHIGWSETTVIELDRSGNVESISNQD